MRAKPSRRSAPRQPGFVTVIATDDAAGGSHRDGLAELLSAAPATHVRSLGGLGQFASVSIRGSAPAQVAMFLDGVPIGSSMAGLVDLADLPVDGLSRIEVHRGHVPIAFGAAAIGGAIDLVSTPDARDHDDDGHARIEAGLGSWWTRQLATELRARTGRTHWAVRTAYGGSTGAFGFYDDRGTRASSDDGITRRTGNAYDRVLAQLRLLARAGAWRIATHQLVVAKRGGVPGPGSAQARAAANDQLWSRTIVRARHDGIGRPGARLEWLLGLGLEARRFRDPLAELGVGRDDQRSAALDLYLSPRLRLPLWRDAYVTLMTDARIEAIAIDQRVERPDGSPTGDATRRRAAVGAGVELEQFAWGDRLQVVPALRVDAIASAFAVGRGQGEQDDAGRNGATAAVSPRVGVRLSPWRWLALRGSAGRYFRAPSLVELFGDRGFFVGNEGLAPERGWVVDGGVTLEHEGDAGAVQGHVAGFWTRTRDLIQWIAAGTIARPENLAGARVRGLETSLAWQSPGEHWSVAINYTLLDSEDRSGAPGRDGRALPGRPRHDLFARSGFGWRFAPRGVELAPRFDYTVELVAKTQLDPSGRYVLPPRALQSLGVRLQIDRRVTIGVELRNLLDARTQTVVVPVGDRRPQPVAIADFIGYPLPGRSVWATLRIDLPHPLTRRRRSPA